MAKTKPITWVAHIASLLRDGAEAQLAAAWVELAAAYGTGQAHDMWSLAQMEAAEAAATADTRPATELVPLW